MSYLKQTQRMGRWKLNVIRKKTRPSRESGKRKGLVPPDWAKACARQARAYKTHPRYDEWCEKCTGDKIQWTKGSK